MRIKLQGLFIVQQRLLKPAEFFKNRTPQGKKIRLKQNLPLKSAEKFLPRPIQAPFEIKGGELQGNKAVIRNKLMQLLESRQQFIFSVQPLQQFNHGDVHILALRSQYRKMGPHG